MTGMIIPFCFAVSALKRLTNSPMFTPCCDSAGPTGGAGLAPPAGHCSFTFALISFFATSHTPLVGCPWAISPDAGLLNLLDFAVFHFNRRIAAENGDLYF